MNSPFGLPVPDPLDAVERSILQPPLGTGLSPDPVAGMLDGLEASIERATPPKSDMYADPVVPMLDAVEASVENQRPPGSAFVHDPLHDILVRLEKEIEGTCIKPPPKPEDPPEPPTEDKYGSYDYRPPVQDMDQISFLRQYALPVHRMRGTRTGIRTVGGGPEYYCYLHENWVWPDDCSSCQDFEEAESSAGDEEQCCQHTQFDSQNGI